MEAYIATKLGPALLLSPVNRDIYASILSWTAVLDLIADLEYSIYPSIFGLTAISLRCRSS